MNQKLIKGISFVAIILGFFMALLDSTIVNIALPKMTEYYGASVESITWVVNGYNLAFAVFIITASRLADQFGRKKVFITGIVIFTLASLACGLANSVELLIVFRVIQGLAGAIIVPVTVPMIMNIFGREKQGMIMGAWGAIAGLAAASGPTLGGLLTENFKWQFIFYVNIPIGILTLILTLVLISESYDPTAGKRIDIGGIVSLSTAMFALTYALIQGNDKGWGSLYIIGLILLSVLAFAAFVIIESKVKEPMLPLSLLKITPFNASSLTLLAMGAGMMGALFMTSFYLTTVMGLTVLQAGLTVSFMPLASIIGSVVAGPLSGKYGSRYFAATGIALMAVAIFLLGGLTPESTRADVIYRLLLIGLGMGMTMSPIMGSGIRNVPHEKTGIASGVMNMTRALGTVLGVAILVAILNSGISSEMNTVKAQASAMVTSDAVLDPQIKAALESRINNTAVSRNSEIPDVNVIFEQIDKQEKASLEKTPQDQKNAVEQAFAVQKDEVGKIWNTLQNSIKKGMSNAFDKAFHYGSLILVLGILFALFSDKEGSKNKHASVVTFDM